MIAPLSVRALPKALAGAWGGPADDAHAAPERLTAALDEIATQEPNDAWHAKLPYPQVPARP